MGANRSVMIAALLEKAMRKTMRKDMRILMGMLILSVLHCLGRSYCVTDNFVNFQSYNLTLYL